MKTLIVIPTYNEADNLEALVHRIFSQALPLHILIVDDNSPDGTGEIADRLAASTEFRGRLHVLHRPSKSGLGRAYRAGFSWALEYGYDAVVQMDADFSHDPLYLPRLAEAAAEADMVIGSRYLNGISVSNWPLRRILLSWGANHYVQAVTGLKVHDCTSGFRFYRRKMLEAIDLSSIRSNGYSFQVEMAYRAHLAGFRTVEVPIIFQERAAGSSKMSGRVILESILMPLRLLTGKQALKQRIRRTEIEWMRAASREKEQTTPIKGGLIMSNLENRANIPPCTVTEAPAQEARTRPPLRLITNETPASSGASDSGRGRGAAHRHALQGLIRLCPAWVPEFVYTVLLRPPLLRRTVNRIILKHLPDRVTAHGITVVLNPSDPVISGALAMGVYEDYQTQLICDAVKPGMRVLDIGANVGYYTALCSRLSGENGHVLAFEPEPTNFKFLEKTIQANGFTQTRLLNTAAGRTAGETTLYLSEDNKGDHRVYATSETDHASRITVPLIPVDAVLGEDEQVDFIKIDVQGAEGLVLDGMLDTLRRSPRAVLLTEFWPAGLQNAGTSPLVFLTTLRDELGMEIWEVDNGRKTLERVNDLQQLISRHPGRKYTNLYCVRSSTAQTTPVIPAQTRRRVA